MAWTSPMTFSSGSVLTAAQLNTHLRDNQLETAPAKATTAGRIFVATGANAIAERAISTATVSTTQTRTSTSYGDLATVGPAVTVTTGANAIVMTSSVVQNNTASENTYFSYAVSGATTISADVDGEAWLYSSAAGQGARIGMVNMNTTLTPGSNTFTMKYRVTGGTGTFLNRRIIVIAL